MDAFQCKFTADASHELRTPLAVIRASAEVALLAPNGNTKSYREALHRVLREAEKNTGLLDSSLTLARADSAASALKLQPLNLATKLTQACERVQLLAQEKGIRFHVETGGGESFNSDLKIAEDGPTCCASV